MAKQKKDLRPLIVENAQLIFSKCGLKKTTMEKIAASSSIAKSSIYYYFKSKEDIFEAVLEKEAQVFRATINSTISKFDSPQDKIKYYVLTRMKMFQKLANFYTAFKKEYIENYAFISRIRKKYDTEEQTIIQDILTEGIQHHNLMIKDTELTSLAILTAMKGFELQWSVEKSIVDIEKDIDFLLEVLFYGLVKRT